jgi:hypothetical protein
MRTYSAREVVPASADAILKLLREPEEIARWAPVPFELAELDGSIERLARILEPAALAA